MAWHDDFGKEMNRMQKKVERFLRGWDGNGFYSDYRRAFTDFEESENEFIVQVELPGIEKENIKIDVNNNNLIIKAAKKKEIEKGDKENEYSYAKSFAGFYQSIPIPDEANSENIDASYKNGILTIKMRKKFKPKNQKTINIE